MGNLAYRWLSKCQGKHESLPEGLKGLVGIEGLVSKKIGGVRY